jgi:hypothetical protein
VLSDGSHDERSPMYQAILAEALLRLSEVAARSPHPDRHEIGDEATRAGRRLARSLAHLVHPDGEYALLNDTAFGIAPTHAALVQRFGDGLSPRVDRVWSLAAAGYAGYRQADGGYLVFDSGPIGPDHQPGHGHADALSFEVSHAGRRIVTDTGVFTYTGGDVREHDRGTAAHNTIEVDGRDQSELWGSFRCARRTSSHWLQAQSERNHVTLSGGYRGPGKGGHAIRHSRRIIVGKHGLSFADHVEAPGARAATLRVHFAPGLRVERADGRWMGFLSSKHVAWTPGTSVYHPEFGVEQERASMTARFSFTDQAAFMWHLVLR